MIQDMMSGGASVEETLELWASSLRDVKGRIRPLFTQDRVAASAGDFLGVLLGNEPHPSMVNIQTGPSGRSQTRPPSIKNATVVLGFLRRF